MEHTFSVCCNEKFPGISGILKIQSGYPFDTFRGKLHVPFKSFHQFQAIRGDICVTILNFDDESMKENGTRSSLDGPLHGGFSKILVNGKRPIRHAMVGDKALWWHECVQPPLPLRKSRPLAAQLKPPFGHSCYNYNFGFRSSLQKSDHPGQRRHEVWYQETMFSALVPYDFPQQEYFLYFTSTPAPLGSPEGVANQQGYLR